MSCCKASKNFAQILVQYKRQVDLLPTEYLRQFFRIKYGDDVHTIDRVPKGDVILRAQKMRRVQKTVRRIEAANMGRRKAMDYILEIAYGRRGKLRWELLQPMLPSNAAQPIPERIIPAVEKSRPPVYSPELTALLTSPRSRMTKHLEPHHLKTPPTLPARADPKSEDARLFGPLSKRREVNIRWRFFASNHRKVLPPLQVTYRTLLISEESLQTTKRDVITRAGIRSPLTQETHVYQDVEALACPPDTPLTRRERQYSPQLVQPNSEITSSVHSHLPKRFLRRSYQRLLSKVPTMMYTSTSANTGDLTPGRFSVELSDHAGEVLSKKMMVADEGSLTWITHNKRSKEPPQAVG